jgi:hypothetical protein
VGVKRDVSKLSRDPKQVRNRLRRSHRATSQDFDVLREVDPRWGKPFEQWDYEELARGRPRAKNGSFAGATPAWVTPQVAAESRRRLRERAFSEIAAHVGAAVQVMRSIMDDPDEDSRVRLDAAKFIIEQVVGKARVPLDIDTSDKVKAMLASALILPSGEAAHPVIDGDFSEEDNGG